MDAHSIDTNFAFPELAVRPLENEIPDPPGFGPSTDEGIGAFRGLAAAIMIQIGVALLGILGWQLWHFIR